MKYVADNTSITRFQTVIHSTMHYSDLLKISAMILHLSERSQTEEQIKNLFKVLNVLIFHPDQQIFANALRSHVALTQIITTYNTSLEDIQSDLWCNFTFKRRHFLQFYQDMRDQHQFICDGAIRKWEQGIHIRIPTVIKDVIHRYFMLFDDDNLQKLQLPSILSRISGELIHKNTDEKLIITALDALCCVPEHYPFFQYDISGMNELLSKLVNGKYLQHQDRDIQMVTFQLISSIMMNSDDKGYEEYFDTMQDVGIFKPWVDALRNRSGNDDDVMLNAVQRIFAWIDDQIIAALIEEDIHRPYLEMQLKELQSVSVENFNEHGRVFDSFVSLFMIATNEKFEQMMVDLDDMLRRLICSEDDFPDRQTKIVHLVIIINNALEETRGQTWEIMDDLLNAYGIDSIESVYAQL